MYVDLHCHILPYVDDGAADLTEALALLRMEAEQGVGTVCLTPHLRDGMFVTADDKLYSVAERLKQAALREEIPVSLRLSREYHYDGEFRERLASGSVIPMGRTILLEFGSDASEQTILEGVELVLHAGYGCLIAHAERCNALRQNFALAQRLHGMGVRLQTNASAILGHEGWRIKRLAGKLLRAGLVFAVASDAHDCQFRPPELHLCARYLEKRFGESAARQMMESNPLSLWNEE